MNTDNKSSNLNKSIAQRGKHQKRNRYYHAELARLVKFIIPPHSKVLEIGCGAGDLLYVTKPLKAIGIDLNEKIIEAGRVKYPDFEFIVGDAQDLKLSDKFDYIIMSDLIGHLPDVWQAFRELRKVTNIDSRVVVTYYNYLWDPIISLAEILRLKTRQTYQNWLSLSSIENILNLNGYEVIRKGKRLFFPIYIPLFSTLINRFLYCLPLINRLCLIEYLVAKQKNEIIVEQANQFSCSVIIPCKDEAGNIEAAVLRTPDMGKHTEIIFVDGNSTDGTVEKIEELIKRFSGVKDIKLVHQGSGKGKGDAVRKGFAVASGEILMILDADLTVPPEDFPKFYAALAEGNGQFINGSRLVYPMEKEAMRFLNKIANAMFGVIFSWLLGQRITDTLCGTKALFKKDYLEIEKGRSHFGNFDPFGDFDLLFGAAKANLKIVEIPIKYKQRVYGQIKIERFKHGLLLLRMSFIAFKKLKLS